MSQVGKFDNARSAVVRDRPLLTYKPDCWMKINKFKKRMKSKINRLLSMPDIRSCQNFTVAIVTEMDIQMNVVSRNQEIFVVDFVPELIITKMSVVQGFTMRKKNSMIRRMLVMMNLSEELLFTMQDSSLEY